MPRNRLSVCLEEKAKTQYEVRVVKKIQLAIEIRAKKNTERKQHKISKDKDFS